MDDAAKISCQPKRLLMRQLLALATALVLWSQPGLSRVEDARSTATSAATLGARYTVLKKDLDNSQFQRPIHMTSSEGKDSVGGEIYAVINSPFGTAASVLDKPAQWCDILLLHLNNKYCRASTENKGTILHVAVGSKGEQALKDAQQVDFVYRVSSRTPEYLQVNLEAEQGPLSTHNYRIVLEAAPTDDGRTFIHFTYAYSFGMVGKLAMEAYLNTVARNKIGFTIVPDPAGGDLKPVGGMRGAVERNTMRYYLAIEAFLGAMSAPSANRMEKSLRDWFAATETYSRQLHEMNENEYLAIKRKEYSRQQSELNPKG